MNARRMLLLLLLLLRLLRLLLLLPALPTRQLCQRQVAMVAVVAAVHHSSSTGTRYSIACQATRPTAVREAESKFTMHF
jgi:hypothetical protein